MKTIRKLLTHLQIAMTLTLLALVILDNFNPTMGFLTSKGAVTFLTCLAVVGLSKGVFDIIDNFRT